MKRLSWYTVKQICLLFVTTFARSVRHLPARMQQDARATYQWHCQWCCGRCYAMLAPNAVLVRQYFFFVITGTYNGHSVDSLEPPRRKSSHQWTTWNSPGRPGYFQQQFCTLRSIRSALARVASLNTSDQSGCGQCGTQMTAECRFLWKSRVQNDACLVGFLDSMPTSQLLKRSARCMRS